MKAVVWAGGLGTRLAEETEIRPKPMVEVGGQPLIWHILKHFGHFGIQEFCLALGYRGEYIKRFFLDNLSSSGSMTLQLKEHRVVRHDLHEENWTVHLMDTGLQTMTGGRLKRLAPLLRDGTFMATYGDGVTDLNLHRLIDFHRGHGKLATITAVRPPARFGGLEIEGNVVTQFSEKPQAGEGWINGGFFVLEPAVLDYIEDDHTVWEERPLERLAAEGQLMAYLHEGFWSCMDTLRDKRLLEGLWQEGQAPWKVWP